jgi:hypothetical protein
MKPIMWVPADWFLPKDKDPQGYTKCYLLPHMTLKSILDSDSSIVSPPIYNRHLFGFRTELSRSDEFETQSETCPTER